MLCIATLGWAGSTDSSNAPCQHMRISLVTCGVGDEAWETFGHTGLRFIDSTRTDIYRDVIFNYGMFNGFDKDFEMKFMGGKLPYYVDIQTYPDFISEYIEFHRCVDEQELLLTTEEKKQLLGALLDNIKPENRYYKYDFFFDNCATRIRDIVPKTIGPGFKFGNAVPEGSRLTFRDIINQYFYYKHWTRVGVNILLGSKIDKVMTNAEIMFLPDYLSKGFYGATVDGRPFSTKPVRILPGSDTRPTGIDGPLCLTIILALLTGLGLFVKKLRWLGIVMRFLILLVTGLLGCLILVMWFCTNHQTCADNFNLLWLLPTNLVLAFFRPKGTPRYSQLAIALLFVTLLLHILKIQAITVLEIVPFLVAQLFVYASLMKDGSAKSKPA
jgi:Domain of unknown function (DUF4105)